MIAVSTPFASQKAEPHDQWWAAPRRIVAGIRKGDYASKVSPCEAIAVLWKLLRDDKAEGKIQTIKKFDEGLPITKMCQRGKYLEKLNYFFRSESIK